MFVKAERKRVYLKIALTGPSGSGKTYSALLLAKGLAKGGPIAGVDTENGSMSLYANLADLYAVEIAPPFAAKKCIEAINAAVAGGFKVLVIDSQTHFWKQILEDKEKLDRQGGNSFTNWGKVRPLYDALKEAILHAPIHIVCCIRAKDEYVLEKNDRGKEAPKKVGMGAIAEPGAEFEYTTVFEIGMDHNATVSKDRTTLFAGEIEPITPATGQRFLDWLDSAEAQEYADPKPSSAPSAESLGNPSSNPSPVSPAGSAGTPLSAEDVEKAQKAFFATLKEKGIEYAGDGKKAALTFLSKAAGYTGDPLNSSKQLPLECWPERAAKLRTWADGKCGIKVLDDYRAQQPEMELLTAPVGGTDHAR